MHMAARSFLLEMSKISSVTQLKQQAVSYWSWGAEAGWPPVLTYWGRNLCSWESVPSPPFHESRHERVGRWCLRPRTCLLNLAQFMFSWGQSPETKGSGSIWWEGVHGFSWWRTWAVHGMVGLYTLQTVGCDLSWNQYTQQFFKKWNKIE